MSDIAALIEKLHRELADEIRNLTNAYIDAAPIISKQDEIIQKYAVHKDRCRRRYNEDCDCGLSAALAALRKLQDGG